MSLIYKSEIESYTHKRVLMITFFFPPQAGVGSIRRLKFAQYISEKGWEPIILTANRLSYRNKYDSSFIKLLKNMTIMESLSLDHYTLMNIQQRKNNVLNGQKSEQINNHESFPTFKKTSLYKSVSTRIKEYLIPDTFIGWLPITIIKAIYIILKYKPQIVYTSCMPYTSHIIGYIIKEMLKIKWVTDFSDLWVDHTLTYDNSPSVIKNKVALWLEKKVIEKSDKVMTIAKPMQDIYIKTYPYIKKEKFEVIYNGFDLTDYNSEWRFKNKKFTMCYAGTLLVTKGSSNNPMNLFQSVSKLIREREELTDKIKINIFGNHDDNTKKLVNDLQIDHIVEYLGNMDFIESLQVISKSDVAVLLMIDKKAALSVIPTKIFDYIGAKKPILALAYKGIVTKIIKEGNFGFIVDPDDIQMISNKIYDLYLTWRNEALVFNCKYEIFRKFDRKKLSLQFAKCLDDLI